MRKLFLILSIILTLGITKSFAETPWSIEFWTAFSIEKGCYGPGKECHITIIVNAIQPRDGRYGEFISKYGENMPHGATIVLIPAAQIGVNSIGNWEFRPLLINAKGDDDRHHFFALPVQKAAYEAATDSYVGYAIQLF